MGKADLVRTETGLGREYWRNVLLAGGFTSIPRWTSESTTGTAIYELPLAPDAASGIQRLADGLGVPHSSVFLAAHAKVLAALTGEQEVVTGYVTDGSGRTLPCRLMVEAGNWRSLVLDSGRIESELLLHRAVPFADLLQEVGRSEPLFETILDLNGDADLSGDVVLAVGIEQRNNDVTIRLRYRTDVLDADYAARVAGYHLKALALAVDDPDAEHGSQSLLSDVELRFQLDEFAGPVKELPDKRFHELFEERVKVHPDAVAARHGDRQWTYGELNARANRLGRSLLARGVRPEAVVAVVTERNLDWMATILAIFKVGGVYLPIEPHFPAERIATTLSRSGCTIVITEPGSTGNLSEALDGLGGVRSFDVGAAYREDHADDDLGIGVGPGQLAYVYFTSGSTGEPKGVMGEHIGMLNHLYAKIDDLGIGEGQTVAQVGPQAFDISLWQLMAALLVGGQSLLIEQETILDPEQFVDKIVDGGVAVMQVVPSYLEVLLSYLEQERRDLPDLHCVSVTGEALTVALARRWFAAQPRIKLANAYGLTETSDDTNHEVMDRAPDEGSVPLGRAVNNVHVRVVDENLSPVPLGAPGEIVFSGLCVCRGYINDPERTRQAFLRDPLREGERLYRSGDYGRWRTDRKLEYLGRRDAQVKIRGFRIEIGEIENTLLAVPDVRNGAVIVTERSDGSKQLVAFYSGLRLDAEKLDAALRRSLPDYMIPASIHWQASLPLTDNGKINRKALAGLAEESAASPMLESPKTPAEERLASAWAEVLAISLDQIGRHDNFFDRGGTSLSAVELVIALDGAISLKDVTRHPILAELAVLAESSIDEPSGLLQQLSESDGSDAMALVCFPYAGGNAVNYQAMAGALRDSGLAVFAVELPGHDLTAAASEPFASFEQVVESVVDEVLRRELAPVLLWGHSSGSAFAVEAARQLQDREVDVRGVFLGAHLLGDASARHAQIEELSGRSNAEIIADLAADGGYTELVDLGPEHAEHVGAAYRHDCLSAHRYLLARMEGAPNTKLSIPVTVVFAADDPTIVDAANRYQDWRLVAEQVDGHELTDGGHYFLRTRPTEAADVVLRFAGLLDAQR